MITYLTQVCALGGHTVCLSRLFLAAYCCFICLFVWFFNHFGFFSPVTFQSSILLFLNYSTWCWILHLFYLCFLLSLCVVYPFTCFFFHSRLSFKNFQFSIFFHSSHPLFTSFSSSSLLLGSLLTLLNVRAQTSPCRAAPSRREQKQLVSLPFPCFLAASVHLTVCLPASAQSSPLPLIHCCSLLQVRV